MNWSDRSKQQLVRAILALDSADETQRFLRDLLTPAEIEEFSKRFEAARLLNNGDSYSDIVRKTGLSSTTIARVSRFLNGKQKGYSSVISKLHHNSSQSGRGMS